MSKPAARPFRSRNGQSRGGSASTRSQPGKGSPKRGAKIASRKHSPKAPAHRAPTSPDTASSPRARPTPTARPADSHSMAHEKRLVKAKSALSSSRREAKPPSQDPKASRKTPPRSAPSAAAPGSGGKKETRMSKSKNSAAAKVSESEAPATAGDFEEEPRAREEPSGPELAVVSPDEEFGVEALDVPPDLSVATSEIESVVPPKPPTAKEIEEGGGDSMLARYFREMATHAVMGPDEELRTAIEVETAEIDHWVQILSYLPAAEYAIASLEADLPKPGGSDEVVDTPQIAELHKLLKAYKKQR